MESSQAFKNVDEMVAEGKLDREKALVLKQFYRDLHAELEKTNRNEMRFLSKLKELDRTLEGTGEDGDADNLESFIDHLRDQLSTEENNQSVALEQEANMQNEVIELDRKKGQLKAQFDAMLKEAQEMNKPQVDSLTKAIAELKEDLTRDAERFENLKKERQEMIKNKLAFDRELQELMESRSEHVRHHEIISLEPAKMKKQADISEKAVHMMTRDVDRLVNILKEHDEEVARLEEQKRICEEERYEQDVMLGNQKAAIEVKDRMMDGIVKNLEQQKYDHESHETHAANLEMRQKTLHHEAARERDRVQRASKEKEQALRNYRKVEAQIQTLKAEIDDAKQQLEFHTRENGSIKIQRKKTMDELEELRRDVDIMISSFLKQEQDEKRDSDKLKQILAEVKELENAVADAGKREQQLNKKIADLSAERESISREAGRDKAALRQCYDEIKVKEIIIFEQKKRFEELGATLQEMIDLYSLIKRERNKYANYIQVSQQAASEIREKNKILENELEVLRRESLAKEKDLSTFSRELRHFEKQVQGQRAEKNKLLVIQSEKMKLEDEQKAQLSKLSATIALTDAEMQRMKADYERAVDARNQTGIQLIDRNDELCILYEKANIQENILKNGELELRKREEEIRVLHIQLKEAKRQVDLYRHRVPEVEQCQAQREHLFSELMSERSTVERLSRDLQTPENVERWRELGGKDAEPEILKNKLLKLEQKVAQKSERGMEKDVVYDEINQMSTKLRNQAVDGREETLDAAKKMNDYQWRIREKNKKMMATLSELSLYQATALKLESERRDKEEALNAALARMEQGLPPTEDADNEFERVQMDEIRKTEQLRTRKDEMEALRNAPATITRTTAEPRPNAYVPNDDMGLPKPYGVMAPFKPTESGTTMRHIRKPEIKPIQI